MVVERLGSGSTWAIVCPAASYTVVVRDASGLIAATERFSLSNTVVVILPSGFVSRISLLLASYARVVRLPSGSTVAIDLLRLSNTLVVVFPSGFFIFTWFPA